MAVSKSRAILNALNKLLPTPLPIARRSVYVPRPVHFARGITIEQTPYKDVVYVHHLRVAFFCALPFMHLSYCRRLISQHKGEYDTYFEGSPATIAERIMQAIEREHLLPELATHPEPAEFLAIIDEVGRRRATIVDRPCCHILLGQHDIALKLLSERANTNDNWFPSASTDAEMALVSAMITALERGNDAAAALRCRCHANALALGFVPGPLPGS